MNLYKARFKLAEQICANSTDHNHWKYTVGKYKDLLANKSGKQPNEANSIKSIRGHTTNLNIHNTKKQQSNHPICR